MFLLGASLFTAPAGSGVVTCNGIQRVATADGKPWRCQADLQAGRAYLAEVTRQTRDVTLEILAPDASRVLKVDSPTVRAGPEFLFFNPRVTGKYTVVVAAVDRGLPTRTIDVQWRELSGVAPGSTLARGLTSLTSAAALADAPRPDDGQRRLTALQSARTSLQAARSDAFEAEALLRIASTYYWTLGDWTRAAESAGLAAAAFDRVSDPVMSLQAKTLRAESLIEGAGPIRAAVKPAPRSARTQFDEAEEILSDCARRFAAAGMTYDQAAAINYLGVSAHYQGRLTEARAHYEAAVRMFAKIGESASEVQSLQNIAVIDFQRGDYVEAVGAYKRLLDKLDSASNQRTYLAILNNLAVAQYALGHTDDALKSLVAALSLTESSAQAGDRARTLDSLGRIYLTLGERERGGVYMQQALDLRQSKAIQDRQGLLTSLVGVADLKRETGAPQRALKLHMQALDQAVSPQEKARVLLAIGQDQMAMGSVQTAVDTFARAFKLDLPEQSRVRYMLMGAYGYARSRNGDAEGRALLLKAAQAQEATGDDDYAAENYARLASEERRSDQVDLAIRHVGKALSLYDAQRIRAVNPDLRATYIANRAAAYELQADLYMTLWQRSSNPADRARLASSALGTAERLRTLALEDFRQFAQQPGQQRNSAGAAALAELDSRLAAKRHRLATLLDLDQPPAEQVASLRREIALLRTQLDVAQQNQAPSRSQSRPAASALSLPQLQASLAGDAAMVTWLLAEERSWVWCITQNSAAAFPLSSGRDIEAAARDLYALWSRAPEGSGDRQRELKASNTILGPIGALLSGKHAVTIVADGPLRAIPFGALWVVGQPTVGTKRLAELATVSYQPALHHWQRNKPATVPTGERILLVGDPVLIGAPANSAGIAELRDAPPLAEPWQLPRLPGSRREVEGIVKIASGWQSDVLLGEAATKAGVMAQPLGTFRILHFATHARLDVHDPQLSSIRLSTRQSEAAQNKSDLSLRDIVGLGLNADAVVLSACEGSLGKEYRGQLSFGLSEAFLIAGARNVLGSLWRVSDVASEKYMEIFYEAYMTRGLSPVAAAQAAARQLMRDPTYGHPYYWAAFVVLAV
jgi:CHAT domain-containing protein